MKNSKPKRNPKVVPSKDPSVPVKTAGGKKLEKLDSSKKVKSIKVEKKPSKPFTVKIPNHITLGKQSVFVLGSKLTKSGVVVHSRINIEYPRGVAGVIVIGVTPPIFLNNVSDTFVGEHAVTSARTREKLIEYLGKGFDEDTTLLQVAEVVYLG